MYYVTKKFEVSAAHRLNLHYDSKCASLHGHNWIITVHCKAPNLNEDGMVADFTTIKHAIHGVMDHKNLNEIFQFNPTAENIAKWIVDKIPTCYKAVVQESENNIAIYEDDD